jgi:DnaJ-class molecular chaperone
MITKKEEIILCTTCDGRGEIYERTSMYNAEWLDCKTCKGKGRLNKITTVALVQL